MFELLPRMIPCLLLQRHSMVKTIRFAKPTYLGDPVNIVRIFNDKEVDEVMLLDIGATTADAEPNFKLLSEIASECFMPLGYGGGLRTLEHVERTFKIGIEKACINSAAVSAPELVTEAAKRFGSQSIVVSIDAKRSLFGRYEVRTHGGRKKTGLDPVAHAKRMEEAGAGEIVITSVDRDGTMQGLDLDLVRSVAKAVRVPVIASGGVGKLQDIVAGVKSGGASAVAVGSFFVFQGTHRAVLINVPSQAEFKAALG